MRSTLRVFIFSQRAGDSLLCHSKKPTIAYNFGLRLARTRDDVADSERGESADAGQLGRHGRRRQLSVSAAELRKDPVALTLERLRYHVYSNGPLFGEIRYLEFKYRFD